MHALLMQRKVYVDCFIAFFIAYTATLVIHVLMSVITLCITGFVDFTLRSEWARIKDDATFRPVR